MKKNLLFYLMIVLLINCGLKANPVKKSYAGKIAKNFYYAHTSFGYDEIEFSNYFTIDENDTTLYYIFNIVDDKGFVIVAADDDVIPVLGYGTEGGYYTENQPPQFVSWMNGYKKQILYVKRHALHAGETIKRQWENYSVKRDKKAYGSRSIVGPLLENIYWNQGCLYNDSCPADASGPCGHAYAGCVATATGMIMKYHSHPHTGTGSHSYYHPTYGTLSADFGSTTYDWANMTFSGSDEQVAQLLYHIGVAVEMNYGPNGSGAYTSSAVTALKTYFSYDQSAYFDNKSNYTNSTWENMLITEIDNNRPLLYRGDNGGSGGHAFVCDGYDNGGGTTLFHFNWGWDRAHNGYFALSNLNPGTHNFTDNQAAGFNIMPDDSSVPNSDFTAEAPCPCSGDTVTFYDQSSNKPNSWNWSFQGGSPTSSSSENPEITYSSTGTYDVTLTASNTSGAGNTNTKTGYITVYNSPASVCALSTQTMGNYWYGILRVKLNNLDHASGDTYSDNGCKDFSCRYSTTLTPGNTYDLTISVRMGSSGNAHTYVYIDFNNDGDFSDSGEKIIDNYTTTVANSANTFTQQVTMPSSPVLNQLLRMRVVTDYTSMSSPCTNPIIGQSEDYGVYFQASPPVPVATAATNITQTSFDANWNASSGATGYYLDVATDSLFTSMVSGYDNLNVGNVTTYSVTGLTSGTGYYYRVRAYNSYGTSGNSNVISLTTLPDIPAAPVATAATNITQTSFDANWNASSGADGYYLDVATDSLFTSMVSGYDNLNAGNVTTYNVTGLTANTDYYYRVRAYNNGGTSGNSNVIALTTLPDIPAAPNATAATNITQTSFDANWDSSTGADGYYLDVATDDQFTSYVSGYENLNVGNVTTYSVTGLNENTDYYYRVRAYNTGGTSGNSNVINVTTLAYPPSAPVATAATNISQTSFDANWNASTGADGYYLDVATDSTFTNFVNGYNNLNVGSVLTYTVSGLTPETDYYYRLRAYNSGGTSGNSNTIALTTLPNNPGAPVATAATNITQTSFDANWDSVSGAFAYYLDVATDNGFSNMVNGFDNLNVGNVTTYPVTGLTPNTQYFYRVRAENSGGISGNSNVISVTTLPEIPPAPIALDATAISENAFTANWENAAGADGYYFDVATDSLFTSFIPGFENLDVGDVLEYTVTGLNAATYYYYRLRAYNVSGTSGNSNVISLVTLPVGTLDNTEPALNIYTSKNILFVIIDNIKVIKGDITVYDLSGIQITAKKLENKKTNTVFLNTKPGILLVKVMLNGTVYVTKIYVRGK